MTPGPPDLGVDFPFENHGSIIQQPMDRPSTARLRIGIWHVNPTSGQISRDGETVRVEARTMRLLMYLAEHAGQVVSIDELLREVWSGVIVTSDSVYQAVASLRRVLGDDPKQPTYIATVPRLGYRMIAQVSASDEAAALPTGRSPTPSSEFSTRMPDRTPSGGLRRYAHVGLAVGATLAIAFVAVYLLHGQRVTADPVRPSNAQPSRKSIAVVPFIDLTDGMSHEYFADGMTEEVIDKLSKAPGLRVAAPTSSFYLKGKQIAIADIAKTLGVTYVLDGSVRKSGTTLRVAARLSRGDDGYVVWSETYDRPLGDILIVQDDIATAVTKALRASIDSS
jgi:transcriptional activator of cad operon